MWLLFEFYLSTDIDNIKAAYPDYRKARNEMQELVRAQKNIERFFAEEKNTTEKTQTRKKSRRGAFPVGRHPRRIF